MFNLIPVISQMCQLSVVFIFTITVIQFGKYLVHVWYWLLHRGINGSILKLQEMGSNFVQKFVLPINLVNYDMDMEVLINKKYSFGNTKPYKNISQL